MPTADELWNDIEDMNRKISELEDQKMLMFQAWKIQYKKELQKKNNTSET